MTSEALQNPYFVRLYYKNIDKTHSLTEPNDKIQYHGNYFFKKGGGTTLEKGGNRPPVPPPPKSALVVIPFINILCSLLYYVLDISHNLTMVIPFNIIYYVFSDIPLIWAYQHLSVFMYDLMW